MRGAIVQLALGLAAMASLAAAAPPALQTTLLVALAVALLLRTPLGVYLALTGALFVGLVVICPLEVKLIVGCTGAALLLLSAALRRTLGVLSLLALGLACAPPPLRYVVAAILAIGVGLLAWRSLTHQPWRGANMLENPNWRVLVLPGRQGFSSRRDQRS